MSAQRRRRVNKMSKARSEQMREYAEKRKKFLASPEHASCEASVHHVCTRKSVDVHHTRGRSGKWLLRSEFWIGTCRACHDWIGANVAEARRMGLIGPWMREGKYEA